MTHKYIYTKPILEELGWKVEDDSWYPNSQYYSWVPGDNASTQMSDIYLFDDFTNSGGHSMTIVWAGSFEEAKKLAYSTDCGIPSFCFESEEELRLLIKMSIG